MATFGRNTKIIFNEDNSYSHPQAPVEQENKRTVFVGNLPRDVKKREIEEIFGEIGPIKRCYLQYPRDDKKQSLDTTVAYITYAIPEDAAQALEKLASHKIGDKKLNLKLSTSTRSEQTRPSQVLRPPPAGSVNSIPLPVKPKLLKPKPVNKKPRLIIRNLSFNMTEEKLREQFSKCGELKEVNILRKPNGKMVGCAFVQYENVHQAINAIKELNFKEMMGRNMAIDWALPKKDFQKTGEDNGDVKEEPTENGDLDSDVKIKSEPLDDDDMSIKKEEDGSGSKKGYSQKRPITIKSEDDDSEDDEEVPKKRQKSNDVEEGKTMFIRNLEFETTDTEVKTFFEQFGEVEYAVLCKDKLTEHPKGTAFVKFKDSDSASQCLEKSNEEPTYFAIGRRQCYVSLAISKERLGNKEKEETKHEEKDGRNLFLAREGFIRPDSSGAQGVSVTDMNQRATLNKVKKQMLKNLNIFISKNRLCIHNLPPQYNDKNLRDICLKHGGEGAKVTEAKVMRDLKDTDINGVGKSKLFGFVTFTEHINALKAIRNLNNNPTVFSKNRRPIVEFSLENRAALKAKEKRAEKSKENNWNTQNSNSESSNDKKSRKQKRKEKGANENSQDSESNVKSGEVVVTGEEVATEKRKKSSKKGTKVDPSAKPLNGSELPKYAGLTAKEGVYKLPMMKSKGKITRNSLKQSKNKKQIRRKREGKSKPNASTSNKDKEDAVDKIVSRHRQKLEGDSSKGKSNKKWYD